MSPRHSSHRHCKHAYVMVSIVTTDNLAVCHWHSRGAVKAVNFGLFQDSRQVKHAAGVSEPFSQHGPVWVRRRGMPGAL